MRRFLQVSTRSLASLATSTGRVASLESACSLGLKLDQRRAISLSQLQYASQRGSSTGDIGGSKDNKDKRVKKSLLEMANEKLSNVGLKTRSASNKGKNKEAPDHQVERRPMSDPGYSGSNKGRNNLGSSDGQKTKSSGHDYDARSGDKRLMSQRRGSPGHKRRNDGLDGDDDDNNTYERKRRSAKDKRPNDHRSSGSIRHDKDKMRFVLDLGDGQFARIDYKLAGKNCLELYHTEVPEELRGRGIGKTLAKGALELASRANLKLKVTCSYLEDYLKHNPNDKHRKLFD